MNFILDKHKNHGLALGRGTQQFQAYTSRFKATRGCCKSVAGRQPPAAGRRGVPTPLPHQTSALTAQDRYSQAQQAHYGRQHAPSGMPSVNPAHPGTNNKTRCCHYCINALGWKVGEEKAGVQTTFPVCPSQPSTRR